MSDIRPTRVLAEVLLDVESVHDLNRLREQFPCQIPDPERSIADHHQALSVSAAPTIGFLLIPSPARP